MSIATVEAPPSPARAFAEASWIRTSVLIGIAALVALAAFGSALADLPVRWNRQEEYSHGYLIPFIAGWLLWRQRAALAANFGRPSWAGIVLIGLAVLLNIVGELSAIYILAQGGFVLSLFGLSLAIGGWPLLRVTFLPLAFLLFAIPLPYFVDAAMSLRLQLLSSELAGDLIRLFGIPVYIDGNVIDLGTYKLQVVDACSGLRYLFPLMSLGFLAAYLFQAPLWQRALIFLSTIPVTVLMNTARIGIIGILTNYFGTGMAEGFLHAFEGWIIFIACSAVLLGEMYLLARFVQRKPFFAVLSLDEPSAPTQSVAPQPAAPSFALTRLAPLAASVAILAVGGALAFKVAARDEVVPDRSRFVSFPSTLGEWRGRTSALEPQTEHALGLDDHVLVDYSKADGKAVNFYAAYYASQRKGTSPHSPIVCIPGGGWQITSLERTAYTDATASFPINRVVIERGQNKQVVYYWFEGRGRRVANEWLSKWYLLADAISMNRSDGALVRLTTSVHPGETLADADRRIHAIIPALSPTLSAYLPPREPPSTKRALLEGGANPI